MRRVANEIETISRLLSRPAASNAFPADMSRKREKPVRLDRIYTRGGDAGETSLGDGSRVGKSDPRIEAYGTVDELNSILGLALTGDLSADARSVLEGVQQRLFDLGADLSVPLEDSRERLRITQSDVDELELAADEANAKLEPLTSFVLPGGTEAAARLHLARTVCRRAERRVVTLVEAGGSVNPLVIAYLNRLSDVLFILARESNLGSSEPLWKPGNSR